MESAFVAGRLIVGSYFLYSAFNHFTHVNMMSGYVASKGVPGASLAIIVSGILLAIAGFTLLLGWYPKVGVAALVLFFVPVTFIMHAFWKVPDPQARMNDMTHFFKNLALLGSSLMFLAIPEPWPISLASRTRLSRRAHA
jgi:putative oxidoreductase